MPDTTAHHYFGQQVFRELGADARAVIAANKSAFDLGLQGPDLLFYFQPYISRNPIRELGIHIHHLPARERMQGAAARLRANPDTPATAYLLGYACHWALDSAFHGEVARLAPSVNEHFQLEAELDRQVILNHYSADPLHYARWRLTRTSMNDYAWLRVVYPELNTGQCRKCAHSVAYYMFLLNAQTRSRRAAATVLAALSGHKLEFRDMMVPAKPNLRFQAAAGQLYARLEGVVPRGVRAVQDVLACVRQGVPLEDRYQVNFE